MIAFNEAIDHYVEEKGAFAPFAQLTIRSRLLDEMRGEYRHKGELLIAPGALEGSEAGEEEAGLSEEVRTALAEASNAQDRADSAQARLEIEAVQAILSAYGFSFFDLADCSPKAQKTKDACAIAVKTLLTHPDLFRLMQENKSLPLKELQALSKVKKKILERHRRYLIAAAEILHGEYPLLATYMDYIRKTLHTG